MTRKLLAGLSAALFASLSTAAFADCVGHTAQTSTPVQTAQTSTSTQSGPATEIKTD